MDHGPPGAGGKAHAFCALYGVHVIYIIWDIPSATGIIATRPICYFCFSAAGGRRAKYQLK